MYVITDQGPKLDAGWCNLNEIYGIWTTGLRPANERRREPRISPALHKRNGKKSMYYMQVHHRQNGHELQKKINWGVSCAILILIVPYQASELYWVNENGVLPAGFSQYMVGNKVAARALVTNDLLCGKLSLPLTVFMVLDGMGHTVISGFQVINRHKIDQIDDICIQTMIKG